MLRAILALLFAILYLIIGIPVLGIEWIISKFNTLVADVTRNIDQYELGLAAAKLNDFIWENFCGSEVLHP